MTHRRPMLLVSYLLEELKLAPLYPAFLDLTLNWQGYLGFLSKVTTFFVLRPSAGIHKCCPGTSIACYNVIHNCWMWQYRCCPAYLANAGFLMKHLLRRLEIILTEHSRKCKSSRGSDSKGYLYLVLEKGRNGILVLSLLVVILFAKGII